MNGLPEKLVSEKNLELTTKLRKAFDLAVSYSETGDYAKIIEVIQFNLIPSFNRWKTDLEGVTGGYLRH